ncbi:MAG TPA: PPOX class F420-dependent oxidoreductase [Aggregatilineales bacterium]|nr:PPOX class F420-dependent oxidoreductase [Anaerolineae bacterium]HUN05882.1 PPOX class F420-dependent oxidoreductase [Aggregatilineales bacterium]
MASSFSNLTGHQYLSLTTFRKNGQPVPTPVWFAHEGDQLFILTLPGAGKVKRIQHTARVTVAPCDVRGNLLGDAVEAQARILSAEEGASANALLTRKYGLFKRLFDLMGMVRGQGPKNRVYLAIRAA